MMETLINLIGPTVIESLIEWASNHPEYAAVVAICWVIHTFLSALSTALVNAEIEIPGPAGIWFDRFVRFFNHFATPQGLTRTVIARYRPTDTAIRTSNKSLDDNRRRKAIARKVRRKTRK